MPTRRNIDSGLAPQEREDLLTSREAANHGVEAGAHLEVAEDSITEANRLFEELSKDLRNRRKQAKLEGKSEGEIKAMKFDKNSETYTKWMEACSNNVLNGLKTERETLTKKKDEAQSAGENVADMEQQLETLTKKINDVEAARKAKKDLKAKELLAQDKQVDLRNKSEQLGGENPAIDAEVKSLDAMIGVTQAQGSIVDALAIGADKEDVELPPPIPADYIHESMVIIEPEALEEIFVAGAGSEKIKAFFSKELARDAKAKIGFREAVFSQKLNQIVGGDEQFADLLLKDPNFKKAAQNLFDTKIGAFGNKALEAAAQFVFTLEQARSIYDNLKANLALEKPEVQVQEVGVADVEKKQIMVPEMKLIFSSFEKVGVETPKKLEAKVKSLKEDMNQQKAALEHFQTALAECKWYELNKKSQIKGQIKSTTREIGVLFEALVDLGDSITAEEVSAKLPRDSEYIVLKGVLDDEMKQLKADIKSGKMKFDSKSFFDKYTEAAVMMLMMATVAFTVLEASSAKKFSAEKPSGKAAAVKTVKKEMVPGGLQSMMPDKDLGGMFYTPSEKAGMTMAEDISTEPKVAPWGGASEEPAIGGYTAAETVAMPAGESKVVPSLAKETIKSTKLHKKTTPARTEQRAKAKPVETVSADAEKTEDQLEQEILALNNQISEKKNQLTPVDLDNPVSMEQFKKDNDAIAGLEAQRDVKVQLREAKRLDRISAQISKEDKVSEAAAPVKITFDRGVDYDSLDFSREYVGKLGTAHDIVREIQELAPVASAAQREEFKKKANSAIVQCDMFIAEKGRTPGEIAEAQKVRQVASNQYRALKDSLPQNPDVRSLVKDTKEKLDQLASKYEHLVGSSKEGAKVFLALDSVVNITKNLNLLSADTINKEIAKNLKDLRAELNSLLVGKELVSAEKDAANQLLQAVDVLLQGVPKSDKLWDIPHVKSLDRAKQIGLEQDIESKASGK